MSGGIDACSLTQLLLDAVDGRDDVDAGLLEDDEEDAALAVAPAGLRRVDRPATATPMSRTRTGAPLR